MDYFKFNNQQKPQKGSLLISEPFLPDPNFERTVVLMCEHNEEGSFGFVMNKPSEVMLHELLEDFENEGQRVFVGGPVQHDTLHFIHRSPAIEGGTELTPGLFWGGNFEQVQLYLNTGEIRTEDIRFFVGYSGWGVGQLEKEQKLDSWIVTPPASADIIFDNPVEDLWKEVLKQLGGRYQVYSNYPTDPRLN